MTAIAVVGMACRYRHAGLWRLLGRESGEDANTAAARVWAAIECLQKAELPADAPLVLDGSAGPDWILLRSGRFRIGTFATEVRTVAGPVVFAVLVEEG